MKSLGVVGMCSEKKEWTLYSLVVGLMSYIKASVGNILFLAFVYISPFNSSLKLDDFIFPSLLVRLTAFPAPFL